MSVSGGVSWGNVDVAEMECLVVGEVYSGDL